MIATRAADPVPITDLLGSFWTGYFRDRPSVDAVAKVIADLSETVKDRLDDLLAVVDRHTIPACRTPRWTAFHLRESDGAKSHPRYGSGRIYGDGLIYGDRGAAEYPLPPNIFAARQLFNRLVSPSVCWYADLDYTIDRKLGIVTFATNPFTHPSFFPSPITEDGVTVDRELYLWAYAAEVDVGYGYDHVGYLVGIHPSGNASAVDLANAVLDADVAGPAAAYTYTALQAATGVRLVGGEETVETVTTDANGVLVMTDADVYRYGEDAVAVVEPGDAVDRFDPLVDALIVHEFSGGVLPEGVSPLPIPADLLAGEFLGGIAFPVATETLVDSRFTVLGHPFDVEALWDYVRAREAAGSVSISSLLPPSGDVSPAEFASAYLLRHGGVLVKVRAGGMGEDAAGLQYLDKAVSIVSPYSVIIVLIEAKTVTGTGVMPTSRTVVTGVGSPVVVSTASRPETGLVRAFQTLFGCA